MTQATALSILKTGTNVFLTGEPGSGKTYVVNKYVHYLRQHGMNVAITASTGIAATHIFGVTIHSWSGIGIRNSLSKRDLETITSTERIVKQVSSTQVLIIDEISMLDANALDMVDLVCRTIRRSPQPFGGLQVVLVGDFYQLPPISKLDEPAAQFAFEGASWSEALLEVCYLTEQHRQSDVALSSVLAAIRGGVIEEDIVAHLHTRRVTDHEQDGATKLYAHNANVDDVNAAKLKEIPGEAQVFTMTHHGPKKQVEALTRGCLSPERLELKKGAAVMCTRNIPEKGLVNGTLGIVMEFDSEEGYPIIQTRTGRSVTVEPVDWAIEDGDKAIASITQIPLRLAWAITIHKSQGMSLDAAVMDLSRSFAFGQGYVALSRVRTLDGLFLLGWNDRALLVDPAIQEQDRTMRALSEQAEQSWQAISDDEQKKRQAEFIRQHGGKMEPDQKTFTPGVAQEIPPHAKRLAEIRQQYPQAYTPWTPEADTLLTELFHEKARILEMAHELQRHPGGIRSRLKKLGLTT